MDILARNEGDICIVQVREPRIDAAATLDFKETVRHRTDDAPARVILDLTEVGFIDSSGLGAIVAIMKHLSPERQLMLAGLTPAVDKVFKLTRMDSVFTIFMTLEEALSAERV